MPLAASLTHLPSLQTDTLYKAALGLLQEQHDVIQEFGRAVHRSDKLLKLHIVHNLATCVASVTGADRMAAWFLAAQADVVPCRAMAGFLSRRYLVKDTNQLASSLASLSEQSRLVTRAIDVHHVATAATAATAAAAASSSSSNSSEENKALGALVRGCSAAYHDTAAAVPKLMSLVQAAMAVIASDDKRARQVC